MKDSYKIYKEVLQDSLVNLENPGVLTVIIYGGFGKTNISFIYDNDPSKAAKE